MSTITDKRCADLMFEIVSGTRDVHTQFAFDEMLTTWFGDDEDRLATFLDWLDGRGLEIRRKK